MSTSLIWALKRHGGCKGESMNPEIGCLIRFYLASLAAWAALSVCSFRGCLTCAKGKLALPVNRWSRRQVHTERNLPHRLICQTRPHRQDAHPPPHGGKLVLRARPTTSAYDSYTEHLRWHRTRLQDCVPEGELGRPVVLQPGRAATQLFYSQDLTHLNLKNNFMSLHKGVPALTRFCKLRSLSLSNNALSDFPLSLCDITSLTELNLSGNRLSSLPVEAGTMHNLQTLLLDGNFLSSLPAELGSLEGLTYLGLSFNCFSCAPPVLEKLRGLERLCLAGNQLSVLDITGLQWLPARHVDLRLNRLQKVTVGDSEQLVHILQLDLRDTGLQELDVRPSAGWSSCAVTETLSPSSESVATPSRACTPHTTS
ncbi:hypothetical protein KUCAC02_023545 [Chaenocephalus aceratus]|uniref:Uncharacterized protein n=1 Tax=Chaenocephalus aceratus TaxID=36190 RepID=A0ACB9XS69_CHAAC|nr:hypothetical protein KUCAC02_023545 [Chaenocephalus aceratus]